MYLIFVLNGFEVSNSINFLFCISQLVSYGRTICSVVEINVLFVVTLVHCVGGTVCCGVCVVM
jgi:hypothetical protein